MAARMLRLAASASLVAALAAVVTPRPRAEAEDAPAAEAKPVVGIERVTTVVPWPRGIVLKDGKLFVLARGVHRSAGGPDPSIEDHGGAIFEVDPAVTEPIVRGVPPGDRVRGNGKIAVAPSSPPFHLWTRELPKTKDTLTDRPYCKLLWDEPSKNFFVVAFAGIDLPEENPTFRKNATDAVHRYDTRDGTWHVVEQHDHKQVPLEHQGQFIPNDTFPHHDPARNRAPHGWVNGPCGAEIVGKYLYVTAKDNTALVQYDLTEIRRRADAPPPPSKAIFRRSSPTDDVFLKVKGQDAPMHVEGTCAAAARDGWMYVAFRTTSQVVRFPITADGDVVQPIVAEYLAQFDPYDNVLYGGSADIFDMVFDRKGSVYVSLNQRGQVWKIVPGSGALVDGRKGTSQKPYVDLRKETPQERSGAGNMVFDDAGNLFVTAGNKELTEGKIRGVVYKVAPR